MKEMSKEQKIEFLKTWAKAFCGFAADLVTGLMDESDHNMFSYYEREYHNIRCILADYSHNKAEQLNDDFSEAVDRYINELNAAQ